MLLIHIIQIRNAKKLASIFDQGIFSEVATTKDDFRLTTKDHDANSQMKKTWNTVNKVQKERRAYLKVCADGFGTPPNI